MNTRILLAAALACFAGFAMAASGDPEVGRKKSTACAACHGPQGVSPSGDFPNLAGQYVDYLATALRHYKNGKRKNPIMQAQVANLSERDIQDLAAYYASQKGLFVKY